MFIFFVFQFLVLSLGCLQLVQAASIASSTNTAIGTAGTQLKTDNDNESMIITSKRQKRRAQDDLLPVDYDSNTVYFRVQKPSLRSLSQPAKEQYDDFLRVLYHNDPAAQYGRYRRDAAVEAGAKQVKREIYYQPTFLFLEQEVRRKKVVKTEKPTLKQYTPAKQSSTAQIMSGTVMDIQQKAIISGQRQQQFAG